MVDDLRNLFAGALTLGSIVVAVQIFLVSMRDVAFSPWAVSLLGVSGGLVLIGGLYSLLETMHIQGTLSQHLRPRSPFALFLLGFGLFLAVYVFILVPGMLP